ncbi:dihydrofolate reductase [Chromohalobacter nigrandesensis]|uniref:dihydrofolate reductase n=1 Tax=Chromohalobacter nigrandesensis TaxID=119863 RepID=UPI001FF5FFA1|nr:dihydrofolate reductase [Chromohalobacter nigrandesensis]MCK0745734.1 dihydrofolate reductase [Chromohalobacter nigrandesensis]
MNEPTNACVDTVVPIALVAAMSRERVIGVDNKMPWHLPEDLKFFKRVTMNKPLVMGRKTFESIGKPLPGRMNIVVTRDRGYFHDGISVCHDLASALEMADGQAIIEGVEDICVIGGGEIFAAALPCATRLYLTEVDVSVDGDAWFPAFDATHWQETQRVPGQGGDGKPDYAFVHYERR